MPDTSQSGNTSGSQDVHWTKQWLESSFKDWLMIIDSADLVEEVNIRNFLPECEHGAIIITSSRSNLGSVLGMNSVEVKDIDEKSGVDLLLSCAKSSISSETGESSILSILS